MRRVRALTTALLLSLLLVSAAGCGEEAGGTRERPVVSPDVQFSSAGEPWAYWTKQLVEDPGYATDRVQAAFLDMGPGTAGALLDLCEDTKHERFNRPRRAVLEVLAGFGPQVVPQLVHALGNEKRRPHALRVINLMGPDAAEAVPALVTELEAASGADRVVFIEALASIGPAAADALPLLEGLYRDEDEPSSIRLASLDGLWRITRDVRWISGSR